MAGYHGNNWTAPTSIKNPIAPCNDYPKNKYIFLKQGNGSIPKTNTILVNPRFNTKVFFNPNFNKTVATPRPNIHVNPNVIKSIPSISPSIPPIPVSSFSVSRYPLKTIPTDGSGRVLVSTKNKLIKVPEFKNNSIPCNTTQTHSNHPSDPYKKVNLVPCKDIKLLENKKLVSTRTKIVNASIQNRTKIITPVRRNSINTRFKYIKTSGVIKKVNRNVIRSKHKIVNNISISNRENIHSPGKISPNSRKKIIFVNKFNSSSFLANNVILKNTKRKSLININGILYQNSPSVLKRANISPRQQKYLNNPSSVRSDRQISKRTPPKLKHRTSVDAVKYYRGQFKFVRPRLASTSKLKKSNMSCPIYKKFGKCNGQKTGTCIKIHNPDQIILCTRFLQGACIKKNCLLSHKVSPEKMPTCKYFLEGLCSRDDCQYLHVKISPTADICKDFLEGFCKNGIKCDRRHQFLCPEFEKTQKCSKKRCEYPHRNSKDSLAKTPGKKIIRKFTKKNEINVIRETVVEKTEKPAMRYYDEEVGNENKTEETLISKRPKLGSLPSFIPFSEEP